MTALLGSTQDDIEKSFRKDLFDPKVLKKYQEEYGLSKPYKHAVIQELIDDSLLHKVRSEIRENVHFTPKETDIYKIHQSGDLANLDGLDDAALSKLPSLLKLRDALYSPAFRKYVATITNSGELSGRKTDMAINVYTPGCHLLCHDDVIGSRRVSYILYLTDPDKPWQDEWGGALRLYPTDEFKSEDGEFTRTPSPDFSKTISPAWNQLSFFAVQPGESFHDVEEVYHAANKVQEEKEGGRIRMAISGWYHIPQFGEEGYLEGEEGRLAEKSSLVQLQGKADRYDFPREQLRPAESSKGKLGQDGLEAHNYDFLLKYMSPTYLTPDIIDQVAVHFTEESSVTLDEILSKKFAARIRDYLEKQEASKLPTTSSEIEKGHWKVARPPHKHRFLYLQQSDLANGLADQHSVDLNPIRELVEVFLPSPEFRWWLEIATNLLIENHSIIARRFRRGQDYALATSHEGNPRLELCLGLTPTSGWVNDADAEEGEEDEANPTPDSSFETTNGTTSATSKGKAKVKAKAKAPTPPPEEADDEGGHEVYMAGDEDGDVGDAAIYKTSADTEDDNVLFASPPAWNKLSIVLRDSGVLKFVKYLSRSAPGDRWDVVGMFGVEGEEDEEDDAAGDDEQVAAGNQTARATGQQSLGYEGDEEETEIEEGSEWQPDGATEVGSSFETKSAGASRYTLESSEGEDEFHGFPESEDSDSD
jgi:Rps23 Pro-64 3,4-dihydroxylase Tpa1-like proline 4-hydroxylase